MFKLKFIILTAISLAISGCSWSSGNAPAPKKINQKPPVQKPALNGSLRGVILDVAYQDGKYCGGRLYFSAGDTVYVRVSNNYIADMILIKSGDSRKSAVRKFKQKVAAKNTQKQEPTKKIVIDVPKSENISFD